MYSVDSETHQRNLYVTTRLFNHTKPGRGKRQYSVEINDKHSENQSLHHSVNSLPLREIRD